MKPPPTDKTTTRTGNQPQPTTPDEPTGELEEAAPASSRAESRASGQAKALAALREAPIAGIMSGMNWTTPVYEELKMDAEIGSYQEDGEWPPIVEPAGDVSDAE